jgi:hypothetical protein
MLPQLFAELTLYPTSEGGRGTTAFPGWGCPCCILKGEPILGYDGWPLLGDAPLEPGETRRLGFVFLSGEEAASIFKAAGKFFLWEGRIVGEAIVVETGADWLTKAPHSPSGA